jgi:hypothetical protein
VIVVTVGLQDECELVGGIDLVKNDAAVVLEIPHPVDEQLT